MIFGSKDRHSMACTVQTKRLRYELNKWKDSSRRALPEAMKVLLKSQLTDSQTVEIPFPFSSLCGRRQKGMGRPGEEEKYPFPRPMFPCAFTLWPTDGCLNFHLFTRQFVLKLFLFPFSVFLYRRSVERSVCLFAEGLVVMCYLLSRRACFWADQNEFSTLFVLTSEEVARRPNSDPQSRTKKTENSVACKLNLYIFRHYCKLCQIFFNVVSADRRRWSTH